MSVETPSNMASVDAYRVVLKGGVIRIGGGWYAGQGLVAGQRVRVQLAPEEAGRAQVHTADGRTFICIAEIAEQLAHAAR